MKRIITISFLLIYLFSTTELYQLLKFPLLVAHFVEHKQQRAELSLLDFLALHYSLNIKKDADYDKDMRLPFKACNDHSYLTITSFILNVHVYEVIKPICIQKEAFSFYDEIFLISSFFPNIWQPPKSC